MGTIENVSILTFELAYYEGRNELTLRLETNPIEKPPPFHSQASLCHILLLT